MQSARKLNRIRWKYRKRWELKPGGTFEVLLIISSGYCITSIGLRPSIVHATKYKELFIVVASLRQKQWKCCNSLKFKLVIEAYLLFQTKDSLRLNDTRPLSNHDGLARKKNTGTRNLHFDPLFKLNKQCTRFCNEDRAIEKYSGRTVRSGLKVWLHNWPAKEMEILCRMNPQRERHCGSTI